MSAHDCKTPLRAEDFDMWICPRCGTEWMANEDDGWTNLTPPALKGGAA